MTISLLILLWCCAWVASLAILTLLPPEDRHDLFMMNQVVGIFWLAPLVFAVLSVGFILLWSTYRNPVVWRRK